jgi:hypothetical protein
VGGVVVVVVVKILYDNFNFVKQQLTFLKYEYSQHYMTDKLCPICKNKTDHQKDIIINLLTA